MFFIQTNMNNIWSTTGQHNEPNAIYLTIKRKHDRLDKKT